MCEILMVFRPLDVKNLIVERLNILSSDELIRKVFDTILRNEKAFTTNQETSIQEFIGEIENSEDIVLISDQAISNVLKEILKELTIEEDYEKYFEFLREIKNTLSAEKRDRENVSKEFEDAVNKYKNFFQDLGLTEEFEMTINSNDISIKFEGNKKKDIEERVNHLISWDADHVEETISAKLGTNIGNIKLISDVKDFIEFVSSIENSTNYVSRGQKDCTYELKPSLHRTGKTSYGNISYIYESQFRQKVAFYDNAVKSISSEELRAYGQHFGLPTNYLDFTEAHLTSLLFAVEDYQYDKHHSIVYFVDAVTYHQNVINDSVKLVDFSDENVKKSKEEPYSDQSYFIKVGNTNDRIHFQKGCFLKVHPNDDLNTMLSKYTKIAVIRRDSKKTILSELFNLGITFENIYPDIDNLVKTIKFLNEDK